MNRRHFNLLTVLLLFCFSSAVAGTEEEEKVSEMNRQFRKFYEAGNDSAFYQYAHEFEEYLKSTGDWKMYYVTKTNEGFYDIRRKNLFRAIRTAEYLDADVRRNNDVDYYYLPTSLMGNIYRVSHDSRRAEQYFVQALDEADDRDPKFTMFVQRFLAQMFCIKDSTKAIGFVTQSEQLAKKTNDMGALTLSKAIKIYIQLLNGNKAGFEETYREYEQLLQQGDTAINHQYDRLVEKELGAAELYYNMGNYMGNNYRSSIIVAQNALRDYPYTKYREQLSLLVLKAKFQMAQESVLDKRDDRYRDAIDEYYAFKNEFPESV